VRRTWGWKIVQAPIGRIRFARHDNSKAQARWASPSARRIGRGLGTDALGRFSITISTIWAFWCCLIPPRNQRRARHEAGFRISAAIGVRPTVASMLQLQRPALRQIHRFLADQRGLMSNF
jgi:hypothetical protein